MDAPDAEKTLGASPDSMNVLGAASGFEGAVTVDLAKP